MPKVTKAIIVDAGVGSRMFPFTKVDSKLMIPILSKPVVAYLVEELAASGVKEVIIISTHIAKLKQFFSKNPYLNKLLKKLKKEKQLKQIHHLESMCKIDLIKQQKPMGWLHEVFHARKHVEKEPFLVCFSDAIYISKKPAAKQVIETFEKVNKNIRANARYLFKPSAFEFINKEQFEFGKDVADLDVFEKLRGKNDLFDFNIKGEFYDIGDTFAYLKTQTVFGLKNNEFGKDFRKYLKKLVK